MPWVKARARSFTSHRQSTNNTSEHLVESRHIVSDTATRKASHVENDGHTQKDNKSSNQSVRCGHTSSSGPVSGAELDSVSASTVHAGICPCFAVGRANADKNPLKAEFEFAISNVSSCQIVPRRRDGIILDRNQCEQEASLSFRLKLEEVVRSRIALGRRFGWI